MNPEEKQRLGWVKLYDKPRIPDLHVEDAAYHGLPYANGKGRYTVILDNATFHHKKF